MKVKAHEQFQEIIPVQQRITAADLGSVERLACGDKTSNWVVNFRALELGLPELARLTQIAHAHSKSGMSFVVVVKDGDYAYWEESNLVVAPDLETAEQYIRMEEMQRQLDL